MFAAVPCDAGRLRSVRVIRRFWNSIWALVVVMPRGVCWYFGNGVVDGTIAGEARTCWAAGGFWEFGERDADSVTCVRVRTLGVVLPVTYFDAIMTKRLREAGEP
jgi:hypothetical protein